jgi:hypothetical protein
MPQPDILFETDIDRSLLELITAAPLPSLGGPLVCESTTASIEAILPKLGLVGGSLEAGLWLLAGHLDRSHSISQELTDASGSYWHGIMHRTEGDFWNAKYWMRRAPRHPIRQLLVDHIQDRSGHLLQSPSQAVRDLASQTGQRLNSPETVAESLIDLVEQAVTKQTEWTQPLQVICWWEWQLLFQLSFDS